MLLAVLPSFRIGSSMSAISGYRVSKLFVLDNFRFPQNGHSIVNVYNYFYVALNGWQHQLLRPFDYSIYGHFLWGTSTTTLPGNCTECLSAKEFHYADNPNNLTHLEPLQPEIVLGDLSPKWHLPYILEESGRWAASAWKNNGECRTSKLNSQDKIQWNTEIVKQTLVCQSYICNRIGW